MIITHSCTDTDRSKPLFDGIPPGDPLLSEVKETTPMDDDVLPHSHPDSIVAPISPTADSTMVMMVDMMHAMLAENSHLGKSVCYSNMKRRRNSYD